MIEDRWINFVLLNGWRIKAEVNEETGDMTLLVSNENGKSHWGEILTKIEDDELKQTFLVKNEKSN
jgi:hypothetical protein|tara:strand:+ start:432 stop:629 length:198 start_codon:yes stop_codon:yes gene_type:complete